MDEILIEDKKYVSSKRAAQITGYAKDYIGQLCREGRVPARLVGRSWYVLDSAIQDHRFGSNEGPSVVQEKKIMKPDLAKAWEAPHYETSESDVTVPPVNRLQERTENLEEPKNLQESWKSWFDHFQDVKIDEEAAPLPIPTVDPEIGHKINEEVDEVDKEEIPIPLHILNQQYPPKELLPRTIDPTQTEQEISIDKQDEKRIDTVRGNILKGIIRPVFTVVGVIIAVASVFLAVGASGHIDNFLISSGKDISPLGISIYNR